MKNRILNSLKYLIQKKKDILNIENFSSFLNMNESQVVESLQDLNNAGEIELFPQTRRGSAKTILYRFRVR